MDDTAFDRRKGRRDATRRRLLDAAWALSREHGLTGWTLRDLGAAVGMRAPSLYGYVDSKHALYDALFADGYTALLERADRTALSADRREAVSQVSRVFVDFAVEDPARFQLLFLRTIPGFEPSPDSYTLARRALDLLVEVLGRAGIDGDHDVDLWTAMITGLASQQVSNDPGGTRWSSLVDLAVDRFIPQQP